MKKKYSLAAHAIHSRIQLVRKRLDWRSFFGSAEILSYNQDYFFKAGKAALIDNGVSSGPEDFRQAVELLMESVRQEGVEEHFVVVEKDYVKRTETAVMISEDGSSVVPFDGVARMTNQEASALADKIRAIHKQKHIFLEQRWALPSEEK